MKVYCLHQLHQHKNFIDVNIEQTFAALEYSLYDFAHAESLRNTGNS